MPTQPPPPPREASKKGEPPSKAEARGNLTKPEPTKIVALNFRVKAEMKKNFKIAAATHGITQSKLLEMAFEDWQKKNS